MAACGKRGKPKAGFPLFPRRLGNLAEGARFPHSHSFDECGGKVENQKQVFHFPTARFVFGLQNFSGRLCRPKRGHFYRGKQGAFLTRLDIQGANGSIFSLKNEPEGGSEAIRRQAPFLFGFLG
jgi:hypothetical protein